MDSPILVTGGTGTLGRAVVDRLTADGHPVRVLSRGRRPPTGDAEYVTGDLRTGAGLAAAVAGVAAVLHCADPVAPLLAALRAAPTPPHLVAVSIVGVDRIPLRYYRAKLADERRIAASGLPATVQRATQFHDLVAAVLRMLAAPPVLVLPTGWRFQPVDVRDVAARLATLARAEPAGRAPDLAGPEVLGLPDLAARYLAVTGRSRRVVSVPLPGSTSRALRAGANLAPDHPAGTVGFTRYLEEQRAAGTTPYGDLLAGLRPRAPRRR